MGSFIVTGYQADNGAARPNRKVRINYNETTDIVTNKSTITITSIELSFDFGAQYWLDGYVKINGQTAATVEGYNTPVSSATVRADGTWVSVTNLAATQIAVAHNADGSGSCVFTFAEKHGFYVYPNSNRGLFAYQNGGSGQHTTFPNPNLTVTLTTIPRASTVSCPNATLGSAVTATITRAVSSFTHTLKVLSGSTVIETLATKTTSTSVSWTPSLANYGGLFAAASKTLGVVLQIDTYSGNTLVGTKTTNVTLTIPNNASTKPTVSATIADTITNPGVYVQSKSKPRIQTTAAGKYNATIATIVVSIDGVNYNGADVTANPIRSSGSVSFTVTVTDSRGYSNTYTSSITVYAYASPALTNVSVQRCDSSGTPKDDGTYVKVVATFTISPLNNTNEKTFNVSSKQSSDQNWTTKDSGTVSAYSYSYTNIISGYSSDYSYDIRITLTDFFGSTQIIGSIQTQTTLIGFHSSGTGISFGKVAERANIFDCALPVCGNVASLFGNDAEIPSGADINTYIECGTWSIPSSAIAQTLLNCPTTRGCSLIVRDGVARARATTQNYCYRHQIIIPVTADAIYIREISSGSTAGVWTYGAWKAYSPSVDGITEEGTSGNWYYRIWSSGKKELWYSATVNAAMTTARGSEYISNEFSVAYPSIFSWGTKIVPTASAQARDATTFPVRPYNVQATQLSGFRYRLSSTASQTINVNVSAYIFGW